MQVESFYFLGCSQKQSRLQVDEIHIFLLSWLMAI
jgi:hypothetical protein